MPVRLQGHASFEGMATGKLSDIAFTGRLQSQDFDFLFPATANLPEKQVQWDSLAADIQLSPHIFAAHNGVLRHGDTAINFDLTMSLQQRRFLDTSPFTARVDMRNTDVVGVLALAAMTTPSLAR